MIETTSATLAASSSSTAIISQETAAPSSSDHVQLRVYEAYYIIYPTKGDQKVMRGLFDPKSLQTPGEHIPLLNEQIDNFWILQVQDQKSIQLDTQAFPEFIVSKRPEATITCKMQQITTLTLNKEDFASVTAIHDFLCYNIVRKTDLLFQQDGKERTTRRRPAAPRTSTKPEENGTTKAPPPAQTNAIQDANAAFPNKQLLCVPHIRSTQYSLEMLKGLQNEVLDTERSREVLNMSLLTSAFTKHAVSPQEKPEPMSEHRFYNFPLTESCNLKFSISKITEIFRTTAQRSDKDLDAIMKEDEDLRIAFEDAEKLYNALKGKMVVSKYTNFPYVIEYIEFLYHPHLSMRNSTQTYAEYIKQKYNEELTDEKQPLIHVNFADQHDAWKKRYWARKNISPIYFSLKTKIEKNMQKASQPQQSKAEDELVDQDNMEDGEQKNEQTPKKKVARKSKQFNVRFVGETLVPECSYYAAYDVSICVYGQQFFKVIEHLHEVIAHYSSLEKLETEIGVIFDKKHLLRQAFTHPSYSSEQELMKSSNQRLEFLGDSVVQISVASYLHDMFTTKYKFDGDWYEILMELIRNKNLTQAATKLNLVEHLLFSQSKKQITEGKSPKILADTLEALAGAVLLDKGLEVAMDFCKKHCIYHEYVQGVIKRAKPLPPLKVPTEQALQRLKATHENTQTLEKQIGAKFDNRQLLLRALTHYTADPVYTASSSDSSGVGNKIRKASSIHNYLSSSTIDEQEDEYMGDFYGFNYESLKFLGVALLKFLITHHVYLSYENASELQMTLTCHALLDRSSLNSSLKVLNLVKYVSHHNQETINRILSDVSFALIAAIYIDEGHKCIKYTEGDKTFYDVRGNFVQHFVLSHLRENPSLDPYTIKVPQKGALQHLCQILWRAVPKYDAQQKQSKFSVVITVNGEQIGQGSGTSKKQAEDSAVAAALSLCEKKVKEFN